MNAEKAEEFLRQLMIEMRKASERWCCECDDAEEMWTEYPVFIHETLDEVEELLEVPRTNLNIISATYGAGEVRTDVTELVRKELNFNDLDMRIDNYSMKGDPAPGHAKDLVLTFSHGGMSPGTITIPEGSRIRINRHGAAIV